MNSFRNYREIVRLIFCCEETFSELANFHFFRSFNFGIFLFIDSSVKLNLRRKNGRELDEPFFHESKALDRNTVAILPSPSSDFENSTKWLVNIFH